MSFCLVCSATTAPTKRREKNLVVIVKMRRGRLGVGGMKCTVFYTNDYDLIVCSFGSALIDSKLKRMC